MEYIFAIGKELLSSILQGVLAIAMMQFWLIMAAREYRQESLENDLKPSRKGFWRWLFKGMSFE